LGDGVSGGPASARRRADRLLRWYPKEWRDRYGDEFGELLVAEVSERARSWPRSVDVACNGVMARLASGGLVGRTVNPSDQTRRSLVTFGWAAAAFLVFAISMWSQLTIAWRASMPATSSTYTAIIIMTVAVIIFVTAALVATVPLAWTVVVSAARRRTPGLLRPVLLFWLGATTLIVGGHHFQHGWSGTGGYPWAHRAIIVGSVLKFMWTSTLAVSAYWAHPAGLLRFPASEIAWMTISAIALIMTVTGAAKTIRRLDMSRRLLRFQSYTAKAATFGFSLFLFGTITWLIVGGTGPANLFQAGTVDRVGLTVMTAALAVAVRAAQRSSVSPSLTAP
jgi:hypothetical protein